MTHSKDTPHIVVVGAGVVGASIAFHLALRGARVTVVEAGEPGQGASLASLAWINARDKNPRHYHDLNRRSLDMWDRFARRLGGDVGLTWGGELRWTATPEGAEALRKRVETLQSWGYPIRLLGAAEAAQEAAQMEPNLVTGPLAAASYTAIDGHVDTARVIRACLAGATARGAAVQTQTPVVGLRLAGDTSGPKRVEAVDTAADTIPCEAVVLAGGPDTPALAAMAGLELSLDHTFGATVLTEPAPPLFRRAAVVHTPSDIEPQLAFRQLVDGSVMVHGGTPAGSLGQTRAEIDRVLAAARRFIPALEGISIKEVRRGRRPIPQDGHPILGFSRAVPNLYLAATHSGVTLAPLIGELAAIEIVDGARIALLDPYRLERFSRL